MRKYFLLFLLSILPFSLVACLPSFDKEAEDHFWQGIEYQKQDNNDLAMEEFTKAIEIDPDYQYAYYNRALVYYQKGDLANSLSDYNKAIELEPDNPYWILERGFINIELGNTDMATKDLERSIEIGLPGDLQQRAEEALLQIKPKP